jgi:shikimate dehydrogenase
MVQPPSGHTALVGVLGDPVRHSLSPAMHNAALAALELDWVYLALPAPAEQLDTVVRGLAAMDCRGLNVTLPHKQAVAALCRELTPLAERLGAVNTLVPRGDGSWLGTNTDVEGFLAPLRQRDPAAWPDSLAVVLGCGGSARAVVAGLVELGVGRIGVAARRPEALQTFCCSCSAWAPQLQPLHWDELPTLLSRVELLVNTTPVGMTSQRDPDAARRSPLAPEVLERVRPQSTVYDLIYTPRPTALLGAAAARGCATIDGLEMLVQQGAAALRLWTGLPVVPVAAMRDAALAALAAPRAAAG